MAALRGCAAIARLEVREEPDANAEEDIRRWLGGRGVKGKNEPSGGKGGPSVLSFPLYTSNGDGR